MSTFTLMEEIRSLKKAYDALEAENRRINKNADHQCKANEELQANLGELEEQLMHAMATDSHLKRSSDQIQQLVAESDKNAEDMIKLSNKLGKAKARLHPSMVSSEGQALGVGKTPAILRRNLLVLAEELSSGIERLWAERKDIENELLIERDSFQKTKNENATLFSENSQLLEENKSIMEDLQETREENDRYHERVNELEAEIFHLTEQKMEFVKHSDLGERIANLEEILEKNILEKALIDFKLGKLSKYVSDDRLLFYIDSWASLQTDLSSLEKQLLAYEIELSKLTISSQRMSNFNERASVR